MARGFFITFESIDGVGKTTQVKRLVESLKACGYPVLLTKEPGDHNCGSCVGGGIRNLLFKSPTTHAMRPGVADMLFLADHIQTAGDVEEAVDNGNIVISDRYADSQFAYAATQSRKAPDWTLQVYREQFGIIPDLTILLRARGPIQTTRFPTEKPLEDIGWALRRGKARQGSEAGKQDGKSWNDVEAQREIQDAYLARLGGQPRTFIADVWETNTPAQMGTVILTEVLKRLSQLPVSLLTEKAA